MVIPATARNRCSRPQLSNSGSEDEAVARPHHRSSLHHFYTNHQQHYSGSGSGSDEDDDGRHHHGSSSSSSKPLPPRCYARIRPLLPSPPRQISTNRTHFAPESPFARAPFNDRSLPLHHEAARNTARARSSVFRSSYSNLLEARGQRRGEEEWEGLIFDECAALVQAAPVSYLQTQEHNERTALMQAAAATATGATQLEGVFQAKRQSLPLLWKRRRFVLREGLQKFTFLRFIGDKLRHSATVSCSTAVTKVGSAEFTVTFLQPDIHYHIRAGSSAERDRWVDCLADAIGACLAAQSWD